MKSNLFGVASGNVAIIYSSKHAVDFPMRETALCIFWKESSLDYVWPVDVHMLFVWANLSA